jgi:peptidylprolyl isomerase
MEVVKEGSEIEILYSAKLEDGTVVDSTNERGPFKFAAGSDGVVQGVSRAVVGMKVGDKRVINVEPKEGYGEYDDRLRFTIPRDNVPAEAKVGDTIFDEKNKNQPWLVLELRDDRALIDANHPLAGKSLTFEVELVSIS